MAMGGTSVYAKEYTKTITGKDADMEWLDSGVYNKDNNGNAAYVFSGDNSIGGMNFGDSTKASVTTGGTLDFGKGISLAEKADITINGNLKGTGQITMNRSGTGTGDKEFLTVNGDVTIRNNDKNNPYVGVGNQFYDSNRWAYTGIDVSTTSGAVMNFNGTVDLAIKGTAVETDPFYKDYSGDNFNWNGGKVGPITDPFKLAVINMNGGNVNIETPESTTVGYLALANYGGTINVNVENGKAGSHDVTIKGNILDMKSKDGNGGDPYFFQNGEINLGLNSSKSSWTGVVDNTGTDQAGNVNLYLGNGAIWNHKSLSMVNGSNHSAMPEPSKDKYGDYDGVSHIYHLYGASSASAGGYIFQRDKADIDINNYSGYTTVFYAHNNDGTTSTDYTAGNIIIESASSGSGVTLVTDKSTNIVMTNEEQVAKVLNALAGKLSYNAYVNNERNLSGKVMIAEGLTSSSAALKTGDVTFDSKGKGTYVPSGKQEQTVTEFTDRLTGDTSVDTAYDKGGVIQEDGTYKFKKDSTISFTAAGGKNAAVYLMKDAVIDVSGVNLNINGIDTKVQPGGSSIIDGIKIDDSGASKVTIKAGELNVTASGIGGYMEPLAGIAVSKSSTDGLLTIDGNVNVSVKDINTSKWSAFYSAGIYANGKGQININGNASVKGKNGTSGLAGNDSQYQSYTNAGGIMAKDGGKVAVNGDVDIAVLASALVANGKGSDITVTGGGSVKAMKGLSTEYGAMANNGTISINVNNEKTKTAGNTLAMDGNVGTMNAGSTANLGFSGSASTLHGIVVNNGGNSNLFFDKGAVWTNEAWGTVSVGTSWGQVNPSYIGNVSRLSGGSSLKDSAYIFQKDSRNITIGDYSGFTTVFYAHNDNGENTGDYTAGDIVIQKAEPDSGIFLLTDKPSSLELSDTEKVAKVLNALAQKLTYSGYAENPDNLLGTVGIASGLTSSAVTLKNGDIKFDQDTGKGSYNGTGAPEHQEVTEFTTHITGKRSADTAYVEAGVLKKDGIYKFEKDSTINYTVNDNWDPPAVIDVQKNLVIDAAGQVLKINGNHTNYGYTQGIQIKDGGGDTAEITAKELDITAGGQYGTVSGITVTQSSDSATGQQKSLKINGNIKDMGL